MVDKVKIMGTLSQMTETPLFHLFGASKELFHSNFLYWLSLQNQKEFLKVVCPSFTPTDHVRIERERNVSHQGVHAKLDFFIVNSNDEVAVIENKVKDYADSKQIGRIQNSVQHYDCSYFVLLTLFKAPALTFPNWEIIDYRELSRRIVPANFTKDSYHRDLIADYKAFTLLLAEFAELLGVSEKYDFAIQQEPDLFDMLSRHKLWEGYQKMRSSHLLMKYNSDYNPGDVQTCYGINHQKATIDFFIKTKNASIGIQIENDQYR